MGTKHWGRRAAAWILCLSLLLWAAVPALAAVQTVAVSVWDGTVADRFAGGDGSASNPYRIATASQLAYLARFTNQSAYKNTNGKYFRLDTDLDLAGLAWTPIGTSKEYFQGTFLGNGHTISNLKIDAPSDTYQGLFGNTYDASIEKLHLVDVSVRGGEKTGALCGDFDGERVYQCSVSGKVVGTKYTGGLFGMADADVLSDCTNRAAVSATGNYTGGIAGDGDRFTRCVNLGKISTTGNNAGGIVGYCSTGTVTDCFNYGGIDCQSSSTVGGIAGQGKTVVNCGNAGYVCGQKNVGGICGELVNGSIRCVWNYGAILGSGSYRGAIVGYALSSSITNTYHFLPSSVSVVCGYTPLSPHANSFGENYTTSVMNTDEFVNRLNSQIDTDLYTPWSRDPALYNGLPYIELRTVQSIRLTAMPSTTTYYPGACFDPTGMVITAVYDDGSTGVVTGYSISPAGALSAGTRYVTVSYGGFRVQVPIRMEAIPFSGSGTQADPYYIQTEQDLRAVALLCNSAADGSGDPAAYYRQTADITLTGSAWQPIGKDAGHTFSGVYDGFGFAISGLTYTDSDGYAGLFGYVSGEISLLTLKDAVFQGGSAVGGIAGSLSGKILGCTVENIRITGNPAFAGGIAARVRGGGISGCTVSGTVSADCAGGIAAYVSDRGVLTLCENDAAVRSDAASALAGGLAGVLTNATITESINRGSVCVGQSADSLSGGACASASDAVLTDISNYGAVNAVSASEPVGETAGGIAGSLIGGKISQCRNFAPVNANLYCGGIVGFAQKHTAGSGTVDLTVDTCWNQGTVRHLGSSSGNASAGGIAGVQSGCSVINCVNTGDVHAACMAGGVSGQALDSAVLGNCANSGAVDSTAPSNGVGGLVGFAGSVAAEASYSSGAIASQSNSGAIAGWVNASRCTFRSCYYNGGMASRAYGGSYGGSAASVSGSVMASDSFCTTLNGVSTDSRYHDWVRNELTNDGRPVPGAWFLRHAVSLSVAALPDATHYAPGAFPGSYDGLRIEAQLSDGSTLDVTGLCSLSEADMTQPGEKTITASLDGLTAEFTVVVYGICQPEADGQTVSVSYAFDMRDTAEFCVLAAYNADGKMLDCRYAPLLFDDEPHTVTLSCREPVASAQVLHLDRQYAPIGKAVRVSFTK